MQCKFGCGSPDRQTVWNGKYCPLHQLITAQVQLCHNQKSALIRKRGFMSIVYLGGFFLSSCTLEFRLDGTKINGENEASC